MRQPLAAPEAGPLTHVRLTGKTALVTGGSQGIGRAIAASFAAAGAKVMICSRRGDNLREAAASIDGDVAWCVANAGDPDAAAAVVSETMDRFGAVDILVNNAATNPYYGELMGISDAQMAKTSSVNQQAIVRWTQLAWEAWLKDHGGTVVNIASIGGLMVEPGIGYYNATKAAIIHLTRQMAVELGPHVRVHGLAPGIVKTDLSKALWDGKEQQLRERIPRGRIGTPEDIGGVALFLASPLSDWMTGSTVVVDGGQHLVVVE